MGSPKTEVPVEYGNKRTSHNYTKDIPQALKVYDWEESFGYSTYQMFPTLSQPRRWVKWACAKFGIKPVKVLPQRKGQIYSWYCAPRNAIYLYKQHYNVWTVLHETAHAITEKKWGVSGHGKRFVGVLMQLLIWTGLYPKTALYASAKAAGVKFVKSGWLKDKKAVRRKASRKRRSSKPTKRSKTR